MNNIKTYKKRLYLVSFEKLDGTIKDIYVIGDHISQVAQEFETGVTVNDDKWSLYAIQKVSKSYVNVVGEMGEGKPFLYVGE